MEKPEYSPEITAEVKRQMTLIKRGIVEILPEEMFEKKLAESIKSGVPLRIKQGFDPTAPDIHLGHTVGIRKLKQFQELGHKVVLIIGDYTSLIGDPSGRSDTRPVLLYEDIMKNAETYQDQFFNILDKDKCEVHFNGEWFAKMDFREYMNLTTRFTVARILERDDFEKRYKSGSPISMHELFYPIMQAYDSVAIKADLELGGTEQKFNLLAGRNLQESFGQPPQCILTLPILVGLDGERKMSKSLGNYIGIEESAKEIFGKVMSIPDELIYQYFEMVTDVPSNRLAVIKADLEAGEKNPMMIKKNLATTLVDMYHPFGSGQQALEEFERVFSKGLIPDDIPTMNSDEIKKLGLEPDGIYLVGLIAKAGLAKSNGEARKLIQGGGVSLNGEKVTDTNLEFPLEAETILKVGKRRFLKLIPA